MMPSLQDVYRVLPEMIWCAFACLCMLLQPLVRNRHFFSGLALTGATLGTIACLGPATYRGSAFFGLIASDTYSLFFHILLGCVSFLVILASDSYVERERMEAAEFYALILFATAGMGVLASAQELLTAFIGLELSSISSYVLAGCRRGSLRPGEAAVKYFLLGSFATAFLLYGIALVYGATGTTFLVKMAGADSSGTLFKLGLALILIGLGFKISAAPFQVWTPDVYEGAPTPVTALFSAGPKAATLALLLRIFVTVPAAMHFWFWAFYGLAVLTMFAGNLGALVQSNVKRMLAYSSIAHAGYVLVAFASVPYLSANTDVGAAQAYAAILFYLVGYALVKIGAFTVVSQLGGKIERHVSMDDYAGLALRHPVAAVSLTLYLLSLLGMPVTAGFFGKFYVFKAAISSHLIWLAVIMAVNSVIGAYYYLRLIVIMYMRDPSEEPEEPEVKRFPLSVEVVLGITAFASIYLGLRPQAIINFILQPNLFGH